MSPFDRIDRRLRHLKVLCIALLVMVGLLLVQVFGLLAFAP